MGEYGLLHKIYESLDDGNGILDFSLESDGLYIWTEDDGKFKIVAEEIESDIEE